MDKFCETLLIINDSLEKQWKQRMQQIHLEKTKNTDNAMEKCKKCSMQWFWF